MTEHEDRSLRTLIDYELRGTGDWAGYSDITVPLHRMRAIRAALDAPALTVSQDALAAVVEAAREMFRRSGAICPDCGEVDPHSPDDGTCAALPLREALRALGEGAGEGVDRG